MHNGDFPDPVPSDRLGRMLLLSMVFHVALFGGLVWYNSRTPKLKPLMPTYTVDLVNMPLPAPTPGPKTEVPKETPAPGPVAKPALEVPEKSVPAAKPSSEPTKAEGRKLQPVEKKPLVHIKPPATRVAAKPVSVPHQHHKVSAPPPKVVSRPAPPAPKHVEAKRHLEPPKHVEVPRHVEAPKHVEAKKHNEAPAPAPAVKPLAAFKKSAPKAIAEVKPPAEKVKKSAPENAAPASKAAHDKSREQQIAQEVADAQRKAAEASREKKIQESIHDVEKGLEAKSRNQAYKEAVGQAAARLSAGKVSAKVSRGNGGGGSGAGGGSIGTAQVAAYGAQVSQSVRRHWQPNCLQRSNMQNLKAVIIVRIMADGSISASWFEKESGDRLFDQSAMSAVTRSSPLPELPPGQDKLEIGITFTPEWKASS
jgi:colicin import membrane protein